MNRFPTFEQHGLPFRWKANIGLDVTLLRIRELSAALRVRAESEGEAPLRETARLEVIAGSAQLEGNPLDVADAAAILAGEPVPAPFEIQDEHRIDLLNHARALDYIDRRMRSGGPVTITDLARIQKRVMTGLLPRGTLGRLRSLPIATYFIESGEKIGDCPSPEALPALMVELTRWLRNDRLDPILRAIGFQFLAREIHPFMAGNRRTARIMQRLLLLEAGERGLAALSSWEWAVAGDDRLRADLPRAVAEARATMDLGPFLGFVLETSALALERALHQSVSPALDRFLVAAELRTQAEAEAKAAKARLISGDASKSKDNSKRAARTSRGRLSAREKDLD